MPRIRLIAAVRLIIHWAMGPFPKSGASWGKFSKSPSDNANDVAHLKGVSAAFSATISSGDSYGVDVAVNGAEPGDPAIVGFSGTIPSNFRPLAICRTAGVVEVTIFNDTVGSITFTGAVCKVCVHQ